MRARNGARIILRAMSYEDQRIVGYFKEFRLGDGDGKQTNDQDTNQIVTFDGFDVDGDVKIKLNIVTDINTLSPETFEKAREYITT